MIRSEQSSQQSTDNMHQIREKYMYPIVSFTAEKEFSGRKEDFLSREKTSQT